MKWRKEGDAQPDILAGIARYRAYVESKRENGHDLQWRNGSTFFNQRGWQDEWAADPQKPVDRQTGKGWDLNSLGTGGL